MKPAVFAGTFGLVFLAELGDKTQIAALALAARHPSRPVFLGAAAAFAVLTAGAVTAGKLLYLAVPPWLVRVLSAGLFAGFGAAALAARDPNPEHRAGATGPSGGAGPFLAAFGAILLAELGDKTQLATAGLAARYDAPLTVFAAACSALWLVTGLAVTAGAGLARRIPPRTLRRASGVLFLAFAGLALFGR